MRIVIITDAWEPQVNGVVRTYQNIILELEKMGHQVKIISPNDFNTIPMPFYREISLAFLPYRKMAKMIDEFRPDGIHIPVEGPLGLSARKYCLKNKKPFTTTFHTMFPDYLAKRAWKPFKTLTYDFAVSALRWFHAPASVTFVATQSLEEQLISWGFQNHFVRLVRGVDTAIFYPSKENTIPAKIPVLLYVGRVATEKNIEAFLNVDIPSHKIVVGGGPDLELLKKNYPNVAFLGVKTGQELGDIYRSADCFVFPSKTDTFGIVLIEALACGQPVAAYNTTGPKDIIVNDLLGAVNDTLETAITQALASKGTAQQRSNHICDNYSWNRVAKVFAAQYK